MKTATHAIKPQSRVSFSERDEVAAQRELYQKLLIDHRQQTKLTKTTRKAKHQAAA
jgi:hypothetical protein